LIGRSIAHYEITDSLGEGGMGVVYRAHDNKLARDVALQVLPQSVAGDADRMARFKREARVLAALNHPNIGAIYGLEVDGDTQCLVLELGAGLRKMGVHDAERDVDFHHLEFLPGSDDLLFVVHQKGGATSIGVVRSGERQLVFESSQLEIRSASYSPTGHLIYQGDSDVWAVPFSAADLSVTADPVLISRDRATPSATSHTLVSVVGIESGPQQFVVLNRAGRVEERRGEPQRFLRRSDGFSLSPDGTRLAFAPRDPADEAVRILDLTHDRITRITFQPGDDREHERSYRYPLWAADGRHVYVTERDLAEGSRVVSVAADGSGTSALVLSPGPDQYDGTDLSRDGRYYFYTRAAGEEDIWYLDLEEDPVQPRPIVQTDGVDRHPAPSPDGRHLAYTSDEFGEDRIWITSFPDGERRWEVSLNVGRQPRWSPDGLKLYFIGNGQMLMEVDFDPETGVGSPVELFQNAALSSTYLILEDGRILVKQAAGEAAEESLEVVENWAEELP
jgi:Tol biopolymer transport system component